VTSSHLRKSLFASRSVSDAIRRCCLDRSLLAPPPSFPATHRAHQPATHEACALAALVCVRILCQHTASPGSHHQDHQPAPCHDSGWYSPSSPLFPREYASPTGASRRLEPRSFFLNSGHCVRLFWAPTEGRRELCPHEGKQPDPVVDPVRRSHVLELERPKVARLFVPASLLRNLRDRDSRRRPAAGRGAQTFMRAR
jgi:hypothetical protein